MRIETASKDYTSALVLPASNEERIISFLHNDKNLMLDEFPDFGPKSWTNAALDDIFLVADIKSLPELPFPNFSNEDSQATQRLKAIDAEWKQPCVYACLWSCTATTPTAGATSSSPGNWVYLGKVAILHPYGYPERRYRLFDFLTDNINGKVGGNERLGISYQWPERIFYHTLRNVAYSDAPNSLKISTFTETLPDTTLSYSIDGWRVIDGSALPIEPIVTIVGKNLTVIFDHELQILPATIKAIVRENGSTQKLDSRDLVTLRCTWRQELHSIQPDFQPTQVIAQGVNQVVREKTNRTYNASTTRSNALPSQATRQSGRITNNGTTNQAYFKYAGDVSISGGLIPAGTNPASVNGGYNGIIATNNGWTDIPIDYKGIVSVVTNAGVTSITAEEVYTVPA
jgi:hypothetical protein